MRQERLHLADTILMLLGEPVALNGYEGRSSHLLAKVFAGCKLGHVVDLLGCVSGPLRFEVHFHAAPDHLPGSLCPKRCRSRGQASTKARSKRIYRRRKCLQVFGLALILSKEGRFFGMRYWQGLLVHAVLLFSLQSAVARDERTSGQPGTADSQVSDRGAPLLSTESHRR